MGPVARDLAIIIPVGSKEGRWKNLLLDLRSLPSQSEIIISAASKTPVNFDMIIKDSGLQHLHQNIQWIKTKKGRGRQLNAGAKVTRKKYLWFLHADSRLKDDSLSALEKFLHQNQKALYFFNLKFLNDGPPFTRINTVGVWIRSHLMHLPFGDQGFCISRELFEKLGGFPENLEYGEDHLFIWKARKQGVKLHCTGAWLYTSARKYKNQGWGKTTIKHMVLTARQAFPQWMVYLKERIPW